MITRVGGLLSSYLMKNSGMLKKLEGFGIIPSFTAKIEKKAAPPLIQAG
jgi:hypothetical protein